jgi:hypothetical protein
VSPHRSLVTSRRTALVGVVGSAVGGALVLAGCEGGDPPASAPTPTSSAPTATPEAPPEDPDESLVAAVVTELDELIAFTSAAAAARPKIAAWPAFETLHRTHRAVLTDAEEEAGLPRVRGSAPEIAERVTRREEQAQRRFADWAVEAQSGRLARLLASMSAAIAQQLASAGRATA